MALPTTIGKTALLEDLELSYSLFAWNGGAANIKQLSNKSSGGSSRNGPTAGQLQPHHLHHLRLAQKLDRQYQVHRLVLIHP